MCDGQPTRLSQTKSERFRVKGSVLAQPFASYRRGRAAWVWQSRNSYSGANYGTIFAVNSL